MARTMSCGHRDDLIAVTRQEHEIARVTGAWPLATGNQLIQGL
jgi:hypothetical protein